MFLDAVNRQNNFTYPRSLTKSFADSSFDKRLCSTKDKKLCSAQTAAGGYVIPLKGENFVFYIGHGDGQDVYVEYAKDSTPEDPVVRITGHSLSGAFDFTAHINDINPENASYAEMCALMGHQKQSGMFNANAALGICRPTPLGMQVGDFTQKVNYLYKSQQYLSSDKISESIRNQGDELLRLYQKIVNKDDYEDSPPLYAFWDRTTYELLRTVDTVGATR